MRKGCKKIGEIKDKDVLICENKNDILKSWKKYLKEMGTVKVFYGRQENYSKEDLQKLMDEGLQKFEEELQDYNLDYTYQLFETSFKEFLEDINVKIEDIDTDKIEECRYLFEEKLDWNYEDLFNFNVILIDKKMYDIEFEGVSSSVEGVMKTKDYKEFRQKALQYITQSEFDTILNNAMYSGSGYFAIIINASEIVEALKKGEKFISGDKVLVGIHSWWNGAGYFEESNKDYLINLDNSELDTSNYGIEAVFGWRW